MQDLSPGEDYSFEYSHGPYSGLKRLSDASFAQACTEPGIKHKFTRAYRPQTNGKAERFIQSALREWAYRHSYPNSDLRKAAYPYRASGEGALGGAIGH